MVCAFACGGECYRHLSGSRERYERGGVTMSNARQGVSKSEVLGRAVEYRDLLRAELATIEGYLSIAETLSASNRRKELLCWLSSDLQAPERLH